MPSSWLARLKTSSCAARWAPNVMGMRLEEDPRSLAAIMAREDEDSRSLPEHDDETSLGDLVGDDEESRDDEECELQSSCSDDDMLLTNDVCHSGGKSTLKELAPPRSMNDVLLPRRIYRRRLSADWRKTSELEVGVVVSS